MPPKKSPKPGLQEQFMTRFKRALPPGIGLAEELADILDVSIDSAYRRIRGETELTIEEIYKITKKYGISVDDVFGYQNETATFAYTKLTDSLEHFESYFQRLCNHLKTISTFGQKKIYYVAEEIPLFYSFYTKKLTEFKLFYWQRSVLNIAGYQNTPFTWGLVPQHLVDTAHAAFKEYLNVPSAEIWTRETVFTGLRQVKFYFDSGILTKEQALELLHDYRSMIEMVQKNATSGRKNSSDKEETYFLYSSEVVLGTNCIYIVMDDLRASYISFNTMNSLTTTNPEFCEETEHWVRSLEKKSTLISGVAEKQRYQFFNGMYKHIDECVETIKAS